MRSRILPLVLLCAGSCAPQALGPGMLLLSNPDFPLINVEAVITANPDCEARDGGYEDRIKQTYPIHPELFDRLYEDWSSLERFQRTRGVLRLMNTVIHALWVGEDQSPLIMPGSPASWVWKVACGAANDSTTVPASGAATLVISSAPPLAKAP